MHYACWKGYDKIVALLMDYHADPEVQDLVIFNSSIP